MAADEASVNRVAPSRWIRAALAMTVVAAALGVAGTQRATAHEHTGALDSAGIPHPGAAGDSLNPTQRMLAASSGAQYPGALWRPASVWNYTNADRPRTNIINRIIIHVAEGSFAATYNWFGNSAAQSSAHYVVGKAGQVAQMVSEQDIAWHAGNWSYNQTSIGIEHEGYTNAGGFTDTQYRASARLAGYIARKYAVRPDRTAVIGHNQVPDPNHPGEWGGVSHHTDPGRYWNWARYIEYLRLFSETTSQATGDDQGSSFSAPGWSFTTATGRYGSTARMARPSSTGLAARFQVALPAAGTYDVFARWPCRSDANPDTPIGLSTAGGYRIVTVNQRARCGVWMPLGTYGFSGGSAWRVLVSRRSSSAGMVLADAVRFVRTSDPALPTMPASLVVEGSTSTSIDYGWGASTDNIGIWGYQLTLNGYRIYIGAGRAFTLPGLTCGTSYTVFVRSIDRVGNRSLPRALTAPTAACPPPPTGLVQTAMGATSVGLQWNASAGASSYVVHVPGHTDRVTTNTAITLTGLYCNRTRTVTVRARDANGALSDPAAVSAVTGPC